jgi:two-component system chemotaxis sensor kinase CheA
VIKPLGRLFENVRGIGGSTILGNGDVALIIDVPMLVRHSTVGATGEQAPRLVRTA